MITTGSCYGRAAARILAAAACALAFAMGGAQAQVSQAEIGAVKANCRSDYMAHCMSVRPGGKEALQCLQSHLDSLNGACKDAVAATMPKPAPPPAAAAPPPPPPHKAAKAPPPPPPPAAAAPPPPKAAAAPPPPPAPSSAELKEAMREHCRSDYMELCRRVPPGGKEALQCMQRNYPRLSPACKTAVAPTMHMAPPKAARRHMRERMREHMRAEPPAAAVAPPPQPDPAMLMARAAELPLRERMRVFRACNQDQATVCPGMPAGGGRIIACLAMHADALSPFCARAVARAMR